MLTISHNTTITGDIKSPGPIQVSGNVIGNGAFEDLLIISPSCVWKGNIVADSIIVEGTITGNMIGRKSIQIASNAQIAGNINTLTLTIAPGAKIESLVNMRPMPKAIELSNQKAKKQIEHKAAKPEKEVRVKQLAEKEVKIKQITENENKVKQLA